MEEANKPDTIEDRKMDLLYHAMKALDEMRGKTLIYSKYRDTQRLSNSIYSLIKEVRRHEQRTEESLQLGN